MEFDGEISSFQVHEDKGLLVNLILIMLLMYLTFLCSKILKGAIKERRGKWKRMWSNEKEDERKNTAMEGKANELFVSRKL